MAATCIKQSSSPPSSPPGTSLRYSGAAVRTPPVRIITVRKKRSRGVQLPVDEYMEKMKNYCSMHDVVVLDERGLDIGSEKMAQLVGDA